MALAREGVEDGDDLAEVEVDSFKELGAGCCCVTEGLQWHWGYEVFPGLSAASAPPRKGCSTGFGNALPLSS